MIWCVWQLNMISWKYMYDIIHDVIYDIIFHIIWYCGGAQHMISYLISWHFHSWYHIWYSSILLSPVIIWNTQYAKYAKNMQNTRCFSTLSIFLIICKICKSKYAKYAKSENQKSIWKICSPHFADEDEPDLCTELCSSTLISIVRFFSIQVVRVVVYFAVLRRFPEKDFPDLRFRCHLEPCATTIS